MANEWTPIRIDAKLFQSLPENTLTRASAGMENLFINEAGGQNPPPRPMPQADERKSILDLFRN